MAGASSSRYLEWQGCLNARDLGGLPTLDGGETRWHSVIRTDYPGTLTPAGLEAMVDYGVRTLIDIRSPQEAAAECYDWAEASGCRRLHLPIEKYYPHVGVLIRDEKTPRYARKVNPKINYRTRHRHLACRRRCCGATRGASVSASMAAWPISSPVLTVSDLSVT